VNAFAVNLILVSQTSSNPVHPYFCPDANARYARTLHLKRMPAYVAAETVSIYIAHTHTSLSELACVASHPKTFARPLNLRPTRSQSGKALGRAFPIDAVGRRHGYAARRVPAVFCALQERNKPGGYTAMRAPGRAVSAEMSRA
jgi:hypothetical protein